MSLADFVRFWLGQASCWRQRGFRSGDGDGAAGRGGWRGLRVGPERYDILPSAALSPAFAAFHCGSAAGLGWFGREDFDWAGLLRLPSSGGEDGHTVQPLPARSTTSAIVLWPGARSYRSLVMWVV